MFDHFGNGLIRITDPENLGVDTTYILLFHILSELGPINGISVMAALICILLKTFKGARVASSRFLISTFVGTPKQGYLEFCWTIVNYSTVL